MSRFVEHCKLLGFARSDSGDWYPLFYHVVLARNAACFRDEYLYRVH